MRSLDVVLQSKCFVSEACFLERPRVRIEAEDTEVASIVVTEVIRNRRSGDAGAATQVDNRARRERHADLFDDVADEKEVQRTVIHRERRAFTGAIKRLVIGKRRFPPLDIGRRQGPQGAGDVAETQVGQVPCFELREVSLETQLETLNFQLWDGVDDGIRTRDSRSHSPELYP